MFLNKNHYYKDFDNENLVSNLDFGISNGFVIMTIAYTQKVPTSFDQPLKKFHNRNYILVYNPVINPKP